MYLALVSPGAAFTVWGISLGIGVVVILVVAALLTLIVRTARRINGTVEEIWIAGQRVANNTVHIPLLQGTNQTVDRLLDTAAGIDEAAATIEEAAGGGRG